MAKQFKKIGQSLFCQDFVMEGALQHNQRYEFLSKLDEHFSFEELWNDKLLEAYKGGAELGQPPYAPAVLLKMLFLSYLFNVSEREIERVINDSLSMKGFLGLSFDEPSPDHSALTKFKNRIIAFNAFKDRDIFTEIFDDIVLLAMKKGITLGVVQSIDSTHTIANVNTRKDKKRTKPIKDGGGGKKPRDPSAKWGVKRTQSSITTKGNKVKTNLYYYGYKNHLSVNTDTNIITSFRVTPFNAYDGHLFKPLMDDDIAKGVALPGETIYTADKAYDNGDNHVWLNQARLLDAIDLNYVKDEDKMSNKKPKVRWKAFTTQEVFEEGLDQRFAVERVNANLKNDSELGRARYLGLTNMAVQTALSCLTHNLKTLVKQLTGVGLRTLSPVHVS